ncbi:hypothetical protein ROZALSC1DRAFT_24895, partial [Rozella allomycis CSF55]
MSVYNTLLLILHFSIIAFANNISPFFHAVTDERGGIVEYSLKITPKRANPFPIYPNLLIRLPIHHLVSNKKKEIRVQSGSGFVRLGNRVFVVNPNPPFSFKCQKFSKHDDNLFVELDVLIVNAHIDTPFPLFVHASSKTFVVIVERSKLNLNVQSNTFYVFDWSNRYKYTMDLERLCSTKMNKVENKTDKIDDSDHKNENTVSMPELVIFNTSNSTNDILDLINTTTNGNLSGVITTAPEAFNEATKLS